MKSYDVVRPILATVEHADVRKAVNALDRALATRVAHRPPGQGRRRRDADIALHHEQLLAALEERQPTLGTASLRAADDAAADDELRADALDAVVGQRHSELADAVAAAGAYVWTAVARARADALRDDPALDPVPAPLEALWPQLTLPELAWRPALVHGRQLIEWNVPAIRPQGVHAGATSQIAGTRQLWDQHLWAQVELGERKGWRLENDGTLRLLTPWPAGAPVRPGLVDEPQYQHPHVHRIGLGGEQRQDKLRDGELVWVGTGPNGERGATVEDVAAFLHPAGMT